MKSGESSIEQRPDTRICVVQRTSDGMKECEGCQRKSVERYKPALLVDSSLRFSFFQSEKFRPFSPPMRSYASVGIPIDCV